MDNEIFKNLEILLDYLTPQRKEKFLKIIEERTRHFTVVLEDIYDPHNASACLRSCEANGIQDVYIIERNHSFSVKEGVSMGSSKWLTLWKFSNQIPDPSIVCFQTLEKKGYTLYGMSSHLHTNKHFISLEDIPLENPIAFIFGSEKEGLSKIALNYLQRFIYIPICGFVESYNISVACAITVYSAIQKLKQSSIQWKLSKEEKKQILLNWLKKDIAISYTD